MANLGDAHNRLLEFQCGKIVLSHLGELLANKMAIERSEVVTDAAKRDLMRA